MRYTKRIPFSSINRGLAKKIERAEAILGTDMPMPLRILLKHQECRLVAALLRTEEPKMSTNALLAIVFSDDREFLKMMVN